MEGVTLTSSQSLGCLETVGLPKGDPRGRIEPQQVTDVCHTSSSVQRILAGVDPPFADCLCQPPH